MPRKASGNARVTGPPAKRGRKPKINRTLIAKIANELSAGNYEEPVARHNGISPPTYYRWKAEGEAILNGLQAEYEATHGPISEPDLKREFREAVQAALERPEVRNVTLINAAGQKEWRAAAWWLERRHPARWRPQVAVAGVPGEPIPVQVQYWRPDQEQREQPRREGEAQGEAA